MRVDREALGPTGIEAYAASGLLIKTLRFKDIKDFGGGVRRPAVIETDSPLHKGYRSLMLFAGIIRNRYVEEMEARGERPLPFPLQASVLRSLRDACVQGGHPDFISMWAGQGAGLARARPAGELVAQLVRDYEALVASLRVV